MRYGQYLIKNRHGTRWYARVIIPKHLRRLLGGKRELRKSTGTADRKKAQLKALRYYLQCQELFLWLGMMTKKRREPVGGDEILDIDADGEIKVFEYIDFDSQGSSTQIIEVDAAGNPRKVDFGGETDLKAAKFELEVLEKLQAQSHERKMELVKEFSHDPEGLKAALGHTPSSMSADVASNPLTFNQVADNYKEFRKSNIRTGRSRRAGKKAKEISLRTYEEELPRVELWKSCFNDQMFHEILPHQIKEVAEWLDYLPSRMSQKGISVEEAIAIAKLKSGEMIPASTYNKWATVLRGILQRGKDIGASNLDLKNSIECYDAKVNRDTERKPFSTEDLQKIFPGKEYGEHFGNKSKLVSMEAKFWLPLIAVLTGCRVEEIAQLTVSDLKTDPETNISYFNVTNEELRADGELKTTKNKNSVRPVPIHPILVDIGLLDYVKNLHKHEGSLFKLKLTAREDYSSAFTKYFSRKTENHKGFIERCGIETSGQNPDGSRWSKSFHSFRHTVTTHLMAKGVPASTMSVVLGQSDENKFESASTYNHKEETDRLEMRRDVIEMIDYPNVDFKAISWSDFCEAAEK